MVDVVIGFVEKDMATQNFMLLYYAFTSLTTVGFGDIHPRSDYERLIIAAFLFCGVIIFSYVSGEFMEILGSYNKLHEFYDDSEALSIFLGILTKFNMDETLDDKFRQSIADYFDYRWSHYKYHVFKGEYLTITE